jgi:hypothetical protein
VSSLTVAGLESNSWRTADVGEATRSLARPSSSVSSEGATSAQESFHSTAPKPN